MIQKGFVLPVQVTEGLARDLFQSLFAGWQSFFFSRIHDPNDFSKYLQRRWIHVHVVKVSIPAWRPAV